MPSGHPKPCRKFCWPAWITSICSTGGSCRWPRWSATALKSGILTALNEFRHEEAEVGQAISNLELKDLITGKRTECRR